MSEAVANLNRQVDVLRQAISSDKNKVAFLLGAGCPVAIRIPVESASKPLIPDIAGLTSIVLAELIDDRIEAIKSRISLPEGRSVTIEDILSHVRLLIEVVGEGEIDEFAKGSLETLEKRICEKITQAVNKELPATTTPYHNMAAWIGSISRSNPVEVFSPNYDLMVESAMEDKGIPYFDGFVGSRRAFFDLHSIEHETLPARWVRLWKLHGSINWWHDEKGNVFRGHSDSENNKQMIYPSHLKYNQSRRMPYLAMQDQLGRFLSMGQAVLVTNGYSFVDQHLNEIIVQKLAANPRAVCFGLLFEELENYSEALEFAQRTTNLILMAKDAVFIGGEKKVWEVSEDTIPEHNSCCAELIKDEASGERSMHCKLGDFNGLGRFLINQTSANFPED